MPSILGANTLSSGFDVDNSLRFDDGSNDYLNRSVSSTGNRRTYTISTWFKRGNIGANQKVITAGTAGQEAGLQFYDGSTENTLRFYEYTGSDAIAIAPNRLLSDPSAWYHVVIAVDTTQATASNRVKYYLNGTQETSFATATYPDQNYDTKFNTSSVSNYIGFLDSHSAYYDGYLAETVLVDGQALDATSFGEFDSDSPNIWKPIDVSGLTFGTNGFYLQYKQSGTSQNSSGLGADTSGNDNHFAVNNLTAVSQSTDTCTNNFCVMNHLDNYFAGSTFSNGNLQVNTANSPYTYNTGTMGMTKGKWYFEGKWISAGSGNSAVGIISTVSTGTSDEAPNKTDSAMYKDDGVVRRNNGNGTSIAEVSNNNLIMVAYDADNNFVYFGYNGTWGNSGDPTSGSSGTGGYDPGNVPASTTTGAYFPMFSDHNSGQGFSMSFNFGSPDYSISSGNSDANNHGNFEYAVPSGYFALCTKNLAEHG